jgi:glucan phosphoethanolaminetransferase (alkaline phosphatase superfamily)
MKSHWSSQLKSYLLNFRSRFTRGAAKRYLYLSVFTGLFAASLPLLDYIHQDVTISTPGEVFLLCIFFVATSLAILASYCFWLKSNAERLLATIVFVYVYMEYYGAVVNWFSWLSTRIGSTKSAVLIQIVGYILVGAMAKLIYLGSKKLEPKGLPKDTLETVAKFACIVVAILNLYSFLAYSLNRQSVNSYKQPQDVTRILSKIPKPLPCCIRQVMTYTTLVIGGTSHESKKKLTIFCRFLKRQSLVKASILRSCSPRD